jgi:hypothetical protein
LNGSLQEEEGHPLQRVWIRIFRLPQKLSEFSILRAPGSMLEATQVVDMISSLKREYGRVEVAVLNVDLLPNMIDTVVIGDILYSLPIQVEVLDDNEEHEEKMDMDDGHTGAARGGVKIMKQTLMIRKHPRRKSRRIMRTAHPITAINHRTESKSLTKYKKKQQCLIRCMVLCRVQVTQTMHFKLVIQFPILARTVIKLILMNQTTLYILMPIREYCTTLCMALFKS